MSSVEHVDVIVVGAGISGIGAAYHLQDIVARPVVHDPRGSRRRSAAPGICSATRASAPTATCTRSATASSRGRTAKSIADGPSILEYLRETVDEYGIEQYIRFHHLVTTRRVVERRRPLDRHGRTAPTPARRSTYTCTFLFMCSGYYTYKGGYTPEFPGIDDFEGQIVHPQQWPDDLDYAGKRVVVIGSGATAMTLVPAMADDAEHVTMLQRSPTYVVAAPGRGRDRQRAAQGAARTTRLQDRAQEERHARPVLLRQDAQARPRRSRSKLLRHRPAKALGDEMVEQHFTPDLQPVGPAAVPDPGRRPLRRDQRRQGVGRDRPHRHDHRDRHPARVRRAPRRRHHRHRHRAATRDGRRDGLHRRR